MNKVLIGVDYGVAREDIASFTVMKKEGNIVKVIDLGGLKDFDYTKYVATEHQVVGEKEDLELFKAKFLEE